MAFMQPISVSELRENSDYIYEIKYDGFRARLLWSKDSIQIVSRNNKDLTVNFPEIVQVCENNEPIVNEFLPIQLDGELVVLNNVNQTNFSLIQKRGRIKTIKNIKEEANSRPVTYIAFDILQWQGRDCTNEKLTDRKKLLHRIFDIVHDQRIKKIMSYENLKHASELMFDYKAEGLVAKFKNSVYVPGKSHQHWFKWKN